MISAQEFKDLRERTGAGMMSVSYTHLDVYKRQCLACGGNIVQHKSRTGRIFYGCDNYPECKYVSWDMPIDQKCPVCGTQLTERVQRGGEKQIICPNKDCPSRQNEVKKPKGRPAKKK